MVTTEIKNKIVAAITANRANYPSDAKHAASLGITAAVYSGVKNGQTERMLSDANWISIARKLGVSLRGEIEWKAARTPTYQFITAQLETCQSGGAECDNVRPAEYRQDVYGAPLCQDACERRVCGLLAGQDQAQARAQDSR